MKTNNLIATALAASLTFAATPSMATTWYKPVPVSGKQFSVGAGQWAVWAVFGCATGIITAAIIKNAQGQGELTAPQAWGCGLPYFINFSGYPMAYPMTREAPVRAKG